MLCYNVGLCVLVGWECPIRTPQGGSNGDKENMPAITDSVVPMAAEVVATEFGFETAYGLAGCTAISCHSDKQPTT